MEEEEESECGGEAECIEGGSVPSNRGTAGIWRRVALEAPGLLDTAGRCVEAAVEDDDKEPPSRAWRLCAAAEASAVDAEEDDMSEGCLRLRGDAVAATATEDDAAMDADEDAAVAASLIATPREAIMPLFPAAVCCSVSISFA
jgi:hypothetical protein